jgi:hypothetical protein
VQPLALAAGAAGLREQLAWPAPAAGGAGAGAGAELRGRLGVRVHDVCLGVAGPPRNGREAAPAAPGGLLVCLVEAGAFAEGGGGGDSEGAGRGPWWHAGVESCQAALLLAESASKMAPSSLSLAPLDPLGARHAGRPDCEPAPAPAGAAARRGAEALVPALTGAGWIKVRLLASAPAVAVCWTHSAWYKLDTTI